MRCLTKPLSRNSIQTIVQAGTPMSGPDTNNICNSLDGTLLYTKKNRVKKNTKPFIHISLGKAGP